MSNSEAKLTVRHDPSSEQEYPLGTGAIVVGRESFNDIVVYDPEVSRRHAQITFQEGRYIIEDLGSTNGTFVNGRRVNMPMPLHNGDVIEMGEAARMIFSSSDDPFGNTVAKDDAVQELDKTMADPEALPDWQPNLDTIEPVQQEPADPGQIIGAQVSPPVGGAPITGSQASLPPPAQEKRDNKRYFLGCGCLFILTVVACGATVFLLDSFASDFLYCGPAKPVFEILGASCS